MSPPFVTAWPLGAGATLAEVLRIAVCPSEILLVASMVMVGAAAAGAAALAEPDVLVAFAALLADELDIVALLAAAPTGGPITMTAEGTLFDEVTKGTLLWVPVACA